MAAITFTGLGSNFDSNAVIDGLVAAEKIPIQALTQHKSDVSSQLSLLAGLVSKLQALGTSASNLSTASTIASVTATSSDETRVKVSATGAATAASHTVVVNKLAQAQTSI